MHATHRLAIMIIIIIIIMVTCGIQNKFLHQDFTLRQKRMAWKKPLSSENFLECQSPDITKMSFFHLHPFHFLDGFDPSILRVFLWETLQSLQSNDFDKNSFSPRWLLKLLVKIFHPRENNQKGATLKCQMGRWGSCATLLQRSLQDNDFDKNGFYLG